jgi:nucleotide-binding universal stress UspA family protein
MFCPARILVPVDFSDSSRAAYVYACDIAQSFGSTIELLHVVVSPLSQAWAPFGELPQLGDATRAWHHDALVALKTFAGQNVLRPDQLTFNVRAGVAAQVIVDYGREHRCDLIVMGIHAARGATDIMRGNTTERVLRMATCPVLAVPARGNVSAHPWVVADDTEQTATLC